MRRYKKLEGKIKYKRTLRFERLQAPKNVKTQNAHLARIEVKCLATDLLGSQLKTLVFRH